MRFFRALFFAAPSPLSLLLFKFELVSIGVCFAGWFPRFVFFLVLLNVGDAGDPGVAGDAGTAGDSGVTGGAGVAGDTGIADVPGFVADVDV